MTDRLRQEDFEPHVGRTFRLGGDAGLVLDRIESGGPTPADAGLRSPFTLIFRTPKSTPVVPEGFYVCEIENGPSHQIYIAPIHTPDPLIQEYQAVFN